MTLFPSRALVERVRTFRPARVSRLVILTGCVAGAAVGTASGLAAPAVASPGPDAAWDTVAALTVDGELVLFDSSGIEIDRIDTERGESELRMMRPAADQLVLLADDAHQLLVVDPGTGVISEFAIPEDAALTPARGSGEVFMAAPTTGGAVGVVVNVGTRSSFDLTDLAASGVVGDESMYFAGSLVASPDGTQFAIAEEDSRSTAVVSFSDAQPFTVPGRPLGFFGTYVVTVDSAGSQERIVFSDASNGTLVQAIDADRLLGAAVVADGSVVAIDDAGSIIRFDAAQPTAQQLGSIGLGADVDVYVGPTSSGFVVVTETEANFFGIDGRAGRTVAISNGQLLGLGRTPQRCLAIGDREREAIALLDTDDQVVLAEAAGIGPVSGFSDDGCTAVVLGIQVTIVGHGAAEHGGVLTLPERWVVGAISPDGTHVVAIDPDRTTRVIDIGAANPDDPTARGVVLGDGAFAGTAFVDLS